MTNRGEKRAIWLMVFLVGLMLAAMPVLLPKERYALFDLAVGSLVMAGSGWRLWNLRRRWRRSFRTLGPY